MVIEDTQQQSDRNAHVAQNIQELQRWIGHGFAPHLLPLRQGDKIPTEVGWNLHPGYEDEELKTFAWQGRNFGLLMKDFTAIDIEASEYGDAILEIVRKKFPDAPVRSRKGSQSRAVLLRTEPSAVAWTIPRPDDVAGDSIYLAEALRGGQLHIIGHRADRGDARLEWENMTVAPAMPEISAGELHDLGEEIVRALRGMGMDVHLDGAAIGANAGDAPGETLDFEMLAEVVRSIPRDDYFYERDRRRDMMHAIAGASNKSEEGRELWLEWDAREDDGGAPSKPGPAGKQWDRLHADNLRLGAGYLIGQLERLKLRRLSNKVKRDVALNFINDLSFEVENLEEDDDDDLPGVMFDGDAPPAPVQMLVEGMVPAEGLTFLGGQSGVGKSFLAVHMSACLASSTRFFGKDIEEKVGVIYLAAESAGTLPGRLEAAKRQIGVEDELLPIAIMRDIPNLRDPINIKTTVKRLRKTARRMEKKFDIRVGLVVIDTLTAAFENKDEQGNAEMAAVCKIAANVGASVGAATLLVHHFGKDQSLGLRGASSLRGAGESILSAIGDRDEERGTCRNRKLVITKQKEGEEGETFRFDLNPWTLGEMPNGKPHIAAAIKQIDGGDPARENGAAKGPTKQEKEARVYDLMHDVVHHAHAKGEIDKAAAMLDLGMTEWEFRTVTGKLNASREMKYDPASKAWTLTKKGEANVLRAKKAREAADAAFDNGTHSPESGTDSP
jgi:hypothetical protein